MRLDSGLYLIWDVGAAGSLDPEWFFQACAPHKPVALQLRAKGLQRRPDELLLQLDAACGRRQIPLIINDHRDWLDHDNWGLHLGQDDGPSPQIRGLLGRSTHDLEQVRFAAADPRVDHLGFGPIATTSSKLNALAPRGLEALRSAVVNAGNKPVVAIGGINKEILPRIQGQGAHAAAVIGAVFNAPNPPAAFAQLCEAWG